MAMMNIEDVKQILETWLNEGYIEGELSVEPEWYVLWRPEELEEINRDYELQKYAPGFIAFGGNGGGATTRCGSSACPDLCGGVSVTRRSTTAEY